MLSVFIALALALATPICLGHVPATHWVVTEQGLITPIMDSAFHMMLPSDLMSFLEQEKRMTEINTLYQSLIQKKHLIRQSGETDRLQTPAYFTADLMKKTPCDEYGVHLNTINLYTSVAMDGSDRNGIQLVDFFGNHADRGIDGSDVPDCKRVTRLPFSMKTFEHFKPMVNRHNLVLPMEKPLRQWLLPGTNLKSFGHMISQGLRRNVTSWLHYNLASIYWRIKGEAYNAIECSRRAVYFAPREFKDITLLNLGLIFHMSKNPVEAAIVLHSAIDHNSHYISHFALGNTYAILEDFNRSIAHYNHCLKFNPTYSMAMASKLSVQCRERYLRGLIKLLGLLKERHAQYEAFNIQYELWMKLEEKAMIEQLPLEYRYGGTRYGKNFGKMEVSTVCVEKEEPSTKKIVACQSKNSNPPPAYNNFERRHAQLDPMEFVYGLHRISEEIESEYFKFTAEIPLNDQIEIQKEYDFQYSPIGLSKDGEVQSEVTPEDNAVEIESNLNEEEEIWPEFRDDQQKYPSSTKISRIKHDFDKSSDWPSCEHCDSWKSNFSKYLTDDIKPKEILHVYLPLENKGFNISAMLSNFINLSIADEHPLPWYPPLCPSTVDFEVKQSYLPFDIVSGRKPVQNLPPSEMLSNILKSYLSHNIKHVDEAEIGQRILTAMNNRVGPKWVLYTLASLYWRARGNTQNGIECLLNALKSFDANCKDAILVSFASILHQLGHIPEAFEVSFEAFAINKIEPSTNFLLSLLHSSIRHSTGQIYHAKQSVRVDEYFMNGWPYLLLKTWHCKDKFPAIFSKTSSKEDPNPCNGDLTVSSFHSDTPEENSSLGGNSNAGNKGMICTAGTESCNSENIHCYTANSDTKDSRRAKRKKSRKSDEESPFSDLLSKLESVYSSVSDLADAIDGSSKKLFQSEIDLKNIMKTYTQKKRESSKLGASKKTESKDSIELESRKFAFGARKIEEGGDIDNIYSAPKFVDDEQGNLIVKVNMDLTTSEEILHVYDKYINFYLSNDRCNKLQVDAYQVNIIKAFQKRDFSSSLSSLEIHKFSTSNYRLKPKCVAPQFDIFMQIMEGETMVFPNRPSPTSLVLLRMLTGDHTSSLHHIGVKIAEAMKKHPSSWIVHIFGALYWQVDGNTEMMVNCLRQSLQLTPEEDKDVPMLTIAGSLFWMGMTDKAMTMAKLVFEKQPKFSLNPFFVGFLHASKGEYEQCIYMYRMAIALDSEIQLMKDYLRQILCILLIKKKEDFAFNEPPIKVTIM